MTHAAQPTGPAEQNEFALERNVMAVNADAVRRIGSAAEALAEQGRLEDAAQFLQTASRMAWVNQPGAVALPQLDAVAELIAERALAPWPGRPNRPRSREQVLHVLTEVYASGGHTRLARRWIGRDDRREHTVVLTRQAAPHESFAEEMARLGVNVLSVGTERTPMLARANALRAAAAGFDLVVLHIHPDDAPAIIAMEPGRHRPPTLFMNHADVAPWIGARAFDVLVGFRESGRIVEDLRGIAPERRALVPLPCDPPRDPPTRAEARAELGIPDAAKVILTVGHTGKFVPLNEFSLPAALLPTLAARPDASVIVLGPKASDAPWAEVVPQAGGRVHVLGTRTDLDVFYAAADVLLESYPVAGGTVVMEAALAGLPVVRYRPGSMARELFWQEPIGDPDPRLQAEDETALAAHIGLLLDDADERERRVEALRGLTLARHTGAGWKRALEAAYTRARELAGRPPPAGMEPPDLGPDDDVFPLLCRFGLRGGGAHPPQLIHVSGRALELAARSDAVRTRFPEMLGQSSCPLAHPFLGAVAFPDLDADDLADLLAELRTLRFAALIEKVTLALPTGDIERGVGLIEPILAEQDAKAGWELDIDVTAHDGAAPAISPGWLAVAASGDVRGWWGDAQVHRVTLSVVHA